MALKNIGYDISTEKNEFGNLLIGNLSLDGIKIDFTIPVNDMSEEEIYQIGRTVVLEQSGKEVVFSRNEIIEKCKILLKIEK